MQAPQQQDVVVIGAGIIGAMCALYLQRAGRSVLLLEREAPASGASAGNAGILAFPEITPMASPGIMRKAPRWLLDPLGPLSIRPQYALRIAPWLWRFWRACTPSQYRRTTQVQASMMQLAQAEMQAIAAHPQLAPFFRQIGTLDLYDSAASFDKTAADWALKAQAGVQFQRVGRTEIDQLQPGLAPQFQHGMFTPTGTQVLEPKQLTQAVVALAESEGVQVRTAQVKALTPARKASGSDSGVLITLADGQQLHAAAAVVACGAWSKPLASSLGDTLPLDTERGYNTTLPPDSGQVQRQLYFNDHGFVVTPLSTGIRVGGAVEFAGTELPPNYGRAQALLRKAQQFLPGLRTTGGTQWMGFRPSLPDCLPAIGPSAHCPHVMYAVGHGHLGLTQSAATGRLISELLTQRPPSVDLTPLRPDRFASS